MRQMDPLRVETIEEAEGEVLELRVPIAYKIDEATRTREIPPINLD